MEFIIRKIRVGILFFSVFLIFIKKEVIEMFLLLVLIILCVKKIFVRGIYECLNV